jgi:hypothetical protein
MMRSVFFIPDPFASRRVPIAELAQEGNRMAVHRLPLPDGLTCVRMALEDIEETPSLEALPEFVGPQIVFGDLVRVFYADGTSEDLDERTRALQLPLSWSEGGILVGEGSAYDDVAQTLGELRGASVAVEYGRAAGGWTARGAKAESWEQEARRLRQGIANLAHRLERSESADFRYESARAARALLQPKARTS